MSRRLRQARDSGQAKGVHDSVRQQAGLSTGCPRDFRLPAIASEIADSLERTLRLEKAETVGEKLGYGRSQVYEWAEHPDTFPLGLLPALARLDYDADLLNRIAHALLVEAAGVAAARRAAGQRCVTVAAPTQGTLF